MKKNALNVLKHSSEKGTKMDRNRPQGREKHVTENGTGVYKKDQVQTSGPVGSGHGPGTSDLGTGSTESSGRKSGVRSATRSPITILLILAMLLFGGGSGLFNSGLVGGGSSGGGNSSSLISSLSGGSSSSAGWKKTSNVGKLDTSVADGSRAKRTQILGNGQDTDTMMIYMCGTDLESKNGMATSDLMEMVNAKHSDKLNIIVYTGGCSRWNNKIISSTKNQVYQVADGGLRCLVADAGSGAMTDPSNLAWFIQYCSQNFPANRNELIFWDHGSGSVLGYGYDEKNKRAGSMTLAGINEALKAGGVTFDFIGFDACLMATAETALMLNNYADYLIGSEETEPGVGWYYTNWVTDFSNNTSMSTVELGKEITDEFVRECANRCPGQLTTLSVIDLAEFSNTVPSKLTAFSNSVSSKIVNKEYKEVSTARSQSREFATNNRIDQIDLVNLAYNMNSNEGNDLANAILGAVKYNRTSSNMTNAYGVSIYFPYRTARQVDSAVKTYNAIGMDASYSKAIQEFASMEVSGQAATGGTSSPLGILLGGPSGYNSYGGSSSVSAPTIGAEDIANLLGAFLGGGSSISGLNSGNTGFFTGRSMTTEDTASYIADNLFDPSALVWSTNDDGDPVIALSEEQWDLVETLDVNMFYDDGAGYIDLGYDNTFEFDGNGDLLGTTDRTWLSINGHPVAYYHDYTETSGSTPVTVGHVPAKLNGTRVDLIIIFDEEHPHGFVSGAREVYEDEEIQAIPKNLVSINPGDELVFLCDYYSYEGNYQASYQLGEALTATENMEISNTDVGSGPVRVSYRFTDIYQQHYWTPTIDG